MSHIVYFINLTLTYVIYLLQITYSVPYALISTHIEPLGLGQGGFLLKALFILS